MAELHKQGFSFYKIAPQFGVSAATVGRSMRRYGLIAGSQPRVFPPRNHPDRILPIDLTQEILRELLSYDPISGIFNWKKNVASHRRVGSVAGSLTSKGYISIWFRHSRYFAHRLAWFHEHNKWPADGLDHIDGNGSNNSIENLREATVAQNRHNTLHRGYFRETGVARKYRAVLRSGGQIVFSQCFEAAEDAVSAYRAAHAKIAGEFSFTHRLPSKLRGST